MQKKKPTDQKTSVTVPLKRQREVSVLVFTGETRRLPELSNNIKVKDTRGRDSGGGDTFLFSTYRFYTQICDFDS